MPSSPTLPRTPTRGWWIVCCARCHDHKYDPMTQKDYYQLFAFFNNIDGPALDGNAALPAPSVKMPTREHSAALAELEQKAAAIRQKIAEELAKVRYDYAADTKRAGPAQQGGASGPRDVRDAIKPEKQSPDEKHKKRLRDLLIEHACRKTRLVFEPLHKQLTEIAKQRTELDKKIQATLVLKERKELRPANILKRGEYDQ